jgi:hypothetical protein
VSYSGFPDSMIVSRFSGRGSGRWTDRGWCCALEARHSQTMETSHGLSFATSPRSSCRLGGSCGKARSAPRSEALGALNFSVDGVGDCNRVLVGRGSDGDDEALAITDAPTPKPKSEPNRTVPSANDRSGPPGQRWSSERHSESTPPSDWVPCLSEVPDAA